jgi:hypothetical protein
MISDMQSGNSILSLQTLTQRLIIAIFLGLSGLLLVAIQYRFQPMIYYDTACYAQYLVLISKGRILEISNIQPLGWSFLAYPLFNLGISPLYCFIFLASLSYVLLLWCTLEILYPYCSPITALIACSVIAFEPYFSSLIWPGLTDLPFTAIIAALTAVCIRADVSKSNSIIIGILAAIACYLRYPGMFLFLGVPVLQLVRSASLKNRIIQASIALGSLSIFSSPIFIRNILAGQDIFWKHPIETGNLLESFVLWISHLLRAALLVPTSWILKIQTDSQWWHIIGTMGILFFLIIMTFTFIFRKNKLLLITFLLAGMYTGAMLLTRFHIETRYLMPSIFLLLIWFFVAIEIIGKKYKKLLKILLSLVLIHAVAASIYMAIVAYNFKGTPDFRESIKELRANQLSGDKIAIVDDKGWRLFAVITDIEPILADSTNQVAALSKIRSIGQTIILATATRSQKTNPTPIFTSWAGILEDWVKKYPNEFKFRYKGKWLMVVDHY